VAQRKGKITQTQKIPKEPSKNSSFHSTNFQVLGYSLYLAGFLMFSWMSVLCFDLFYTFVYTSVPLKDRVLRPQWPVLLLSPQGAKFEHPGGEVDP
jgi:hypothetical protein